MLILLNHAGNLEGISDLNYDIDKDMVENNINNLNNNISILLLSSFVFTI